MTRIARHRMLGAGYTGPREAGYDEQEMSKLRALDDQGTPDINTDDSASDVNCDEELFSWWCYHEWWCQC